jgi:NADH-quinone oxidoreductase subunit M
MSNLENTLLNTPLISLNILIPIVCAMLILIVSKYISDNAVKLISLGSSLVSFICSFLLVIGFNKSNANMQFIEKHQWIKDLNLNLNYNVGIDGLSLWLVVLTTFITSLIILAGWKVVQKNIAMYNACFLTLSGLTIGSFTALDGILFYVFFEATLIPMYLIIGVWGGKNRVYAAFKFFIYTLLGSLLSLLAIIYLYTKTGSFDVLVWHKATLTMQEQIYIFLAFMIAFAVKIPMWPVHTWLPDAHVEAPTGGSMLLAAIMLKLGAYGFLRFAMPINPDASIYLAPMILTLSLIAIIYIGFVALVQTDMKKLVAYSSIAHMGFVTLGFFIFNSFGIAGGIVQMISHGFISAAMFYCIGVLYDRVHSRNIADYGGVVNNMPKFAAFSLLFAMANCGLPATSGFVGEFLVIVGAVKYNLWIGILAATTLILSAAYSLWMYKRVVFGKLNKANDLVGAIKDINTREFFILFILAISTIFMGLYPKYFLDFIMPSVDLLMQHLSMSKI